MIIIDFIDIRCLEERSSEQTKKVIVIKSLTVVIGSSNRQFWHSFQLDGFPWNYTKKRKRMELPYLIWRIVIDIFSTSFLFLSTFLSNHVPYLDSANPTQVPYLFIDFFYFYIVLFYLLLLLFLLFDTLFFCSSDYFIIFNFQWNLYFLYFFFYTFIYFYHIFI